MEQYNKRLEDKIHELFINKETIEPIDLYNALYVHDAKSKFNINDREVFICLSMYLFAKDKYFVPYDTRDVDKYSKELADKSENCSFAEFYKELNKYKNIFVDNVSVYDHFLNGMLIESGYEDDTKLCVVGEVSKDPYGQNKYKLFIPVDNTSLYKFASLLVTKAVCNKMDYVIELNNDETKQLGNNISISVDDMNCKKYMQIIYEILLSNPDIIVDNAYMPVSAYPIGSDVGVIPNPPRYMSITPLTSLFEYDIFELITEGKKDPRSFEAFAYNLKKYLNTNIKPLMEDFEIQQENKENKLL